MVYLFDKLLDVIDRLTRIFIALIALDVELYSPELLITTHSPEPILICQVHHIGG